MIISDNYDDAVATLLKGQVIAYPTEAVYGLGCDPFNEQAVQTLLALKKRDRAQGLILIASQWDHIMDLIQPLSNSQMASIKETWPGPITWVFPASARAPKWITGEHETIALRLTKHPIAKTLCDHFGKPIVSTSANQTGHPPAKDFNSVIDYFQDEISFIMKGKVGSLKRATPICDAITGNFFRQ